MEGFLPILIMIGLGAGFAGGSVLLSQFVGPSHPTPEKSAAYECGMPPVGDARDRHSVKFYLVAMIFLLFDIEVAFLYPWAIAFRDLGIVGFFGPTRCERRMLNAPNPAPSPIMMRMGTQPCMRPARRSLVNVFSRSSQKKRVRHQPDADHRRPRTTDHGPQKKHRRNTEDHGGTQLTR